MSQDGFYGCAPMFLDVLLHVWLLQGICVHPDGSRVRNRRWETSLSINHGRESLDYAIHGSPVGFGVEPHTNQLK